MLCRDPEAERRFGEGVFLAFRFAITCCAADARPVSVLVKPAEPFEFKEGQWARVEGVVAPKELGASFVVLLEGAHLRLIRTPSEPYAYP
jgi:uncharacterized membrane protein YcgQ (UPF0703/DUF1980 family)